MLLVLIPLLWFAWVLFGLPLLPSGQALQLDLTEDRRYTLSPGVRPFLDGLDASTVPVRATLYQSGDAMAGRPELLAYTQRVRDTLGSMADASSGRLTVTVVEVEPFSEAEEAAQAAGLLRLPQAQGPPLTLGLVLEDARGRQEVLPVLDPASEASLEYEVLQGVAAVTRTQRPRLGVVTSLPLLGPGDGAEAEGEDAWLIREQLEVFYDLVPLGTEGRSWPTPLNEAVDAVLAVHPQGLDEAAVLHLKGYLLDGGRMLACVDPFSEAQLQADPLARFGQAKPKPSDLGGLLRAFGVVFNPNEVVLDRLLAPAVQTETAAGPQALPYLQVMILEGDPSIVTDGAARRITHNVGRINLVLPGSIEPDPAVTSVVFTPLLQTSAEADTLGAVSMATGLPLPTLLAAYQPIGTPQVLAAHVAGRGAGASDASPRAELIVVADTDLLRDRTWADRRGGGVRVIADNPGFLLNALEVLIGEPLLSQLRGRGRSRRPFEAVLRIQRRAEQAGLARQNALQAEVEAAQKRLAELQAERGVDSNLSQLSPEQAAEVETLRASLQATRKDLRRVRYELNRDVERLGFNLKLLNALLWPALVALLFGLYAAWRQRRPSPYAPGPL